MKVLAMVALAYALTGSHYVWRDLREPAWNRPAYADKGFLSILFMMVYWLPGTIFSTYVRGPIKRHILSWIIIVGLLIGLYFGSGP
jgi:hypothetical protein